MNRLARRIRRQARRQRFFGNITREQYNQVLKVTGDKTAMQQVEQRIHLAGINPWENPHRLMGADWSTFFAQVWDWVKEYWPQILKIILTIAPLLLMEEDNDNS